MLNSFIDILYCHASAIANISVLLSAPVLLVYVTSPCLIVPLFVRVSMLLPFYVKGAYTSRAVLLVGVLPYSLFCLCIFDGE